MLFLRMYLDGMLVQELGGIHSAIPGEINLTMCQAFCIGLDGENNMVMLAQIRQQCYLNAHQEDGKRDAEAVMNPKTWIKATRYYRNRSSEPRLFLKYIV